MLKWWRALCARNEADSPLIWQTDSIKDAWFASHFHYAADVVAEWLEARDTNGLLLDFGCGDGITALGLMLRHGYPAVEGVDISTTHQGLMALADREIKLNRLPSGLQFRQIQAGEWLVSEHPYSAIMSWSAFEHIGRSFLQPVVSNLYDLLAPGGLLFIQINPLFYSPQGSHLGRFQLPDWAHLQWSKERIHQEVMAYRGDIPAADTEENFHIRSFGEYKAWVLQEFDQLNRITVDELRQCFEMQGFELVREVLSQVAQMPPEELKERFPEKDLRTEEVRFLFKRRIN